jgi:hypothetical protein
LLRQKKEITKQVHTRHDIIVTWAGRARDEVRYMDENLFFISGLKLFQQYLAKFS